MEKNHPEAVAKFKVGLQELHTFSRPYISIRPNG